MKYSYYYYVKITLNYLPYNFVFSNDTNKYGQS